MIRQKMNYKYLVLICLVISLIALAGCSDQATVLGSEEKLSVRLPIPIIESAFTPFYTAIDKGYYSDEDLDVTFNLGSPETNPVKMVASGTDQFGVIGGPDTLLVARSKGQPLAAIAMIHRDSDFPVILTLKESRLTELEDLKDKKIGFFYGHISTDVLHNLLNKYNIRHEEVDVGFDYSQLIAKKIDAQWAFRTTAGLNLPSKGIDINVISPKDYGINTHGYTIFATEETIQEHPEIVERFLRATIKGIKYTLENPDDALLSTFARDTKLDPILERKRLGLYMEVMSNSEEYPIGYMDYDMFKETYDRLKEENVIEEEFDVNEAFTTKFLEEIYS